MPNRLIELVEKLPQARVLLVGDLMLDRYLFGHAERLSPDAPVPVLHYQREETRLGGAGRVAADLATLGAKTTVLATVGDDEHGRVTEKLLTDYGCAVHLVRTPGRPTTCKTRLVGLAQHRHPQQMLRLDFEDPSAIPEEITQQLLTKARELLRSVDVLCIEDYNKGLLPPAFCQSLISIARSLKIPTIIDPSAINDYSKYAGATALKPNRFEAARATGSKEDTDSAQSSAKTLLAQLGLEASIVTLDRHGVYYLTDTGEGRQVTGRERKVYDVTGAGDMLLAVLCAARAVGATWDEAVTLGNLASGLECEKDGSVPLTRQELIQELMLEGLEFQGKQRTLERLLPELELHRKAGKKIVFTNGCFDLLHLGHVEYFRFAKRQGDLLVVAVNTDGSIRRLKGEKRPVVSEDDRISVLEELESIDYLLKFDTDTPQDLIAAIQPDVLVKGADYRKEQVVGWDLVEARGGRVELAPLISGRSTSNLISKILDAYQPPR